MSPIAIAVWLSVLSAPGAEQDAAARGHWAFQPLRRPALPAVEDAAWCATPIDHFVLARIEASGRRPAEPASRRTWVRRVTYDLTGLPPTPGELDAFRADDGPGAEARLVDRLLSSPRHGERWGRHWLDVARYADSNGLDENLAYANAFRYRDWVIDAFNDDMPYDRFVHEQLAGDLLPAEPGEDKSENERARLRRLIATGFLAIGPKMLACDDGKKMELDIVDEQTDTTSRVFMGLTMGCARCHDHKFDPFPTEDYYALAGIFKSTRTMENFKVVAEWHEHVLATPEAKAEAEAHEERLRAVSGEIDVARREAEEDARRRLRRRAGDYLIRATRVMNGEVIADGASTLGPHLDTLALGDRGVLVEAEAFARGTVQVDRERWGPGIGVLLQEGFAEYDVELPRAGAYQLELRYAAQDARPMTLSINGDVVSTNAAGKTTGGWLPDHQQWHLEGVFELRAGANVLRLERFGVVPHVDKVLLARVEESSRDASLDATVLARWLDYLRRIQKDGAPDATSPWANWRSAERGADRLRVAREIARSLSAALDAWDSLPANEREAEGARLPDDALERSRRALFEPEGPLRLPEDPAPLFSVEHRARLAALEDDRAQLEKTRPVFPRAMGVRDGEIEDLPVLLRGDYLTPGDVTPRRFPAALTTSETGTPPPAIPADTSGRLALARWLTSPGHPLTARVMANRVWLAHFGEGLVRSPDNFGLLGEAPTHPELLDWLAVELRDSGWSLEHLHRLIVLSATYRMSSRSDEHAAERDPENREWQHVPRRRLSAEELRDTLLRIGGVLDLTMHGQLLPDANRNYVTGTGSKGATYDFFRRSVYLPVLRSAVYPVFQAFDFPDPSVPAGMRASTIVPAQALFLLNSDLVLENTLRFADRLLATEADDAARLDIAYRTVLCRTPSAEECARDLAGLDEYEEAWREETQRDGESDGKAAGARRLAWRSLLRELVASNELIFIE